MAETISVPRNVVRKAQARVAVFVQDGLSMSCDGWSVSVRGFARERHEDLLSVCCGDFV